MKYLEIPELKFKPSAIALGCMRINSKSIKEIDSLVKTAMDNGINYFDHADIYGNGECEELFGKSINLRTSIREKMIIQTKCGIVMKRSFDFSKEHIVKSVEGSLKRLGTDYVDVLLLHRPDALMEPDEVADAFETLYNAGKVKHFGVSNHNSYQIELLQKSTKHKILFNQMQLSIMHSNMINQGLTVNMDNKNSVMKDGMVLDYCRLKDITIQPWSPFQYGMFEGVFLDNPKFPDLNKVIDKIADKYNVTNTAIAIAWILRHPANMQPILGSTNEKRITDACKACDFTLTRQEWYEINIAADNLLP